MTITKALLYSFSFTRVTSTMFDSAWLIALPIFFASLGHSESQFAPIMFFLGAGEVLGFLVLPFINSFFSQAKSSLFFDISAALIFLCASIMIYLDKFDISFACLISFFSAIFYSIWFSNSDAFLSNMQIEDKVFLQKNLVFSNNVGPTFGSIIGPILLTTFGLSSISFINSASFIFQFITLKKIISKVSEKESYPSNSRKVRFLETFYVLKKSIIFKYVVLSSVTIKLSFLSIPFILVKIKSSGATNLQLIAIACASGMGTLISLLLPYKKNIHMQANIYMFASTGLVIFSLVGLSYTFFCQSTIITCTSLFFMGLLFGQYLLTFRLLRQQYEPAESIPYLNASGGLLARLALPIGAIIIPLITETKLGLFIYSSLLLTVSVLASYLLKKKIWKIAHV